MDLGITGQVAVISGAGRGIGAATARLIAAEGARVVVWDRDEEPALAVANEICASGGEAIPLAGSVASRDDVESMARRVADHFGTVHILVNNAGFAHITEATATTDAQWTDMLNVHMTGAFNCVHALAPLMIRQKYGRIINISSLSVLGADRMAAYAAAKAGLLGLTRSLMVELGPHNITVNAVLPGYIRTDRVKNSPAFPVLNERARRAQALPAEGMPQDVANAVLFLASSKSGFVTGDFLYVTGGMYQLW
jgi:3-oxoacyl-[acyl-carrier protein] reductase